MTLSETCKACGFKNAKEMAALCGFSPQYLNRMFRERPVIFWLHCEAAAMLKVKIEEAKACN